MAFDFPPRDGSNPEGVFSARFAMGIVIILLGMLFMLDSFDVIESRHILRHAWPLIFVVIGISILSRRRQGRKRNEGWVFVVVGAWLFLGKLEIFDVSFWGIVFPSILLFVGGMLVWRSLKGSVKPPTSIDSGFGPPLSGAADGFNASAESGTSPKYANFTKQTTDEDHAEYIRTFAVLSGTELRPVSRPFRGADLSAILAGIQLDLTSARMEGDTARIEVFSFCGGIEIHVPPDWTVTSKVATLMGGFSDKRRPTTTLPTKTLIVDGFVIMGGIEVKN